jgi:hypothetical protein
LIFPTFAIAFQDERRSLASQRKQRRDMTLILEKKRKLSIAFIPTSSALTPYVQNRLIPWHCFFSLGSGESPRKVGKNLSNRYVFVKSGPDMRELAGRFDSYFI